ncbi:MAG: hypothetical protein KIT54_07295 [Phycisphaeraceae bacterium]|nr:hypothetical protein [Phycisphaeraceae bacterium]
MAKTRKPKRRVRLQPHDKQAGIVLECVEFERSQTAVEPDPEDNMRGSKSALLGGGLGAGAGIALASMFGFGLAPNPVAPPMHGMTSYTAYGHHYAVGWIRNGDRLEPVAKGSIPIPRNELRSSGDPWQDEPADRVLAAMDAEPAESQYSDWRVRTRVRRQHQSTGQWNSIERVCVYRARTAEEAREMAKKKDGGCCWGPTPPWAVLGCDIVEITKLND